MNVRVVALLALVGLALPAGAQRPTTPPPGSPLRKAILDALRRPVEKELRPPIVFQVRTLRVLPGWAFVSAEPQRPEGKPVDFRKIPMYRELIDQQIFDGPSLYALLQQVRGRWKYITHVIGPTDVAWADWDERFGAPRALLPLP